MTSRELRSTGLDSLCCGLTLAPAKQVTYFLLLWICQVFQFQMTKK